MRPRCRTRCSRWDLSFSIRAYTQLEEHGTRTGAESPVVQRAEQVLDIHGPIGVVDHRQSLEGRLLMLVDVRSHGSSPVLA